MNIQTSSLTEPFSTILTTVGFLFSVGIHVISQMILSSKSFSTNITGIRSFISVCSLVDEKIVGFSKLTVTELADKSFLGFSGYLGVGVHHGVEQ